MKSIDPLVRLSSCTTHQCLGRLLVRWCFTFMVVCPLVSHASNELYRCPGPLFTNTLTPEVARARGCEQVFPGGVSQARTQDGVEVLTAEPSKVPVTVPHGKRRKAAAPAPVSGTSTAVATASERAQHQVPDTEQSQRDQDARHILQAELDRVTAAMAAARAPGGDASRLARLQSEEQALQREMARLSH